MNNNNKTQINQEERKKDRKTERQTEKKRIQFSISYHLPPTSSPPPPPLLLDYSYVDVPPP
jgi:hypothetical protein